MSIDEWPRTKELMGMNKNAATAGAHIQQEKKEKTISTKFL